MQRRMLTKEDEAASGGDEVEKEKEDLDDISNELELADEDDKIPYKIGDSFISLPLPEVQDLLVTSTSRIEKDVSALEARLEGTQEEMAQLKVELYARFGKSINLET
ncbi:prefoldin subunit 4 [Diplocarpon rosae]|nr:prefoldin subunit 4 [Diplocarpon rosae]